MTRHALLDNVAHRDLRVATARGARWGDAVMHAPLVPAEFRSAQAHYPIVFGARPGDAMRPLALFGLRPGENLFLADAAWDAHYLPLAVERGPFLIGADATGEPSVHVDLDHPRIGTEGEPLFLEHGGTTAYLDRMASVLRALHEGLAALPAFVGALQAHALLESFVLDVELEDGTLHRLAGFHAIAEERVRDLDAVALEALHRAGHLEPVYMAVASMAQFRNLIERSNRARVAGR